MCASFPSSFKGGTWDSIVLVPDHCLYQLLIYMCASFPSSFKGGTWDSIVLVPDHCLSFYFANVS